MKDNDKTEPEVCQQQRLIQSRENSLRCPTPRPSTLRGDRQTKELFAGVLKGLNTAMGPETLAPSTPPIEHDDELDAIVNQYQNSIFPTMEELEVQQELTERVRTLERVQEAIERLSGGSNGSSYSELSVVSAVQSGEDPDHDQAVPEPQIDENPEEPANPEGAQIFPEHEEEAGVMNPEDEQLPENIVVDDEDDEEKRMEEEFQRRLQEQNELYAQEMDTLRRRRRQMD